MGIQGLLPLLKSIQKPTHLRNFAGQTLGVDAYGWLHRGTVACAIELAQGKPTRKHIEFAMSRVRMLIHFGVKPYIVFDGDYLPSKAHTEKERAERRKESRRLGLELLSKHKAPLAQLELQKAVDVTASMARELIEELKGAGVPYVVAPYEADSQLAYLEQQGVINGILSEDSDLLVFGAKCLLTKLDQYGECVMINRADFTSCREISLVGWSDKEFRIMAMLSGCDYLPGIDKMGLKTAYRLVRKHNTVDRIVRTVQFDGKMKVPADYLEAFQNAERTFLYQWVFCPEAQALVNLNPVPADIDINDMPYLGVPVEASLAIGVAKGDLDPNTKRQLLFNRPTHQAYRPSAFSTPDLKQGLPITDFFKQTRTPLAELDPNSFTPSPSQARLQQNNRNNSWSASQVPAGRRPISTRTSTNFTPASAPQPVRRTVSAAPNFAVASPKRQRLCSNPSLQDSAVVLPGADSVASTSRFFSKQPAQASPSVRKASRKRDEFEIFSDDSVVEGAVAAAESAEASQRSQQSQCQGQSQSQSQHVESAGPAKARKKAEPNMSLTMNETCKIGAGWDSYEDVMSKKRKKMEVYFDKEAKREREEKKEASQSTVATQPSQDTATTATQTPLTSFEASQSQSQSQPQSQDERNVFQKGIAGGLANLKAYSYNSSSKPTPTPQRTQRRNGTVHPSLQEVSTAGLAEQARRRSTMARSATRSPPTAQSPVEQPFEEREECIPASSPPVAESRTCDEDDVKSFACEQRPPRTRLSPGEAKGSEDFIVPESPSSDGDEDGARIKVDFSQYAFAGRA